MLFKLDSVQAMITGHREAITFVLARGMIPPSNHYDDLENTYVVFSLSPVGLLHPSLWGFSSSSYPSSPRRSFGERLWGVLVESREASPSVAVGILQLLLSLLAQMKLRQLRLPLLHAQVLHHAQSLVIHLSLGLVLRGISDSLPRNVLVHETLLAIAVMIVASLKIAHVSDSPLAIAQATDGDSLQEIPLLLCVGVRPVPPLMMNTLGNPHHGLLLGNPHHSLLGNPHHGLLLGNPRHGLLLGSPHHGLLLGNPHHGLLLPPFGRWWISFSRPFLSIRLLLPIHRRDHSIICYYGRG